MQNILDNERVEVGQLLNGRLRRSREMLLLVLAGDGVLVAEDEVNLSETREYSQKGGGTRHAPWCPGTSSQDQT